MQKDMKPLVLPGKSYVEKVQAEVSHPDDIDGATDRLGITPSLINVHLASMVHLPFGDGGPAVNLPVQISRRFGGRKSLYYLHPGEKVLAGVVATSSGVLLRYVSRDSGRSLPAEAGDEYTEEFRNVDGSVVASLPGKLDILNASRGEGRLSDASSGGGTQRWRWIAWSFYADGD